MMKLIMLIAVTAVIVGGYAFLVQEDSKKGHLQNGGETAAEQKQQNAAAESTAKRPIQRQHMTASTALAPAWTGSFPYLGMRTGMTKQEAIDALNIYRSMTLDCHFFEGKGISGEFCRGSEKELDLRLNFSSGRLNMSDATDKYSPFGVFTVQFLQRLGAPDERTETELKWSVGRSISSKGVESFPAETCRVYLDHGEAHAEIVEWGVRRIR